jgi:putative component of toxin-antitoxin plasmid stabilization module
VPRFRIIREIVDSDGAGFISKWMEDELTAQERAKIEVRFNQIEANQTENRNWLKPYVSLKLWEVRIEIGNKAIRFLCHRVSDEVILLLGCIKKGNIKGAEEQRATDRKDAVEKGELSVRDYPLPQRG